MADVEGKLLQDMDSRGRLRNIPMIFQGLSCALDFSPEECRTVLQVPAARKLAREFAEQVTSRNHTQWAQMLSACCQLGFNPRVGSQQEPLVEALLRHLPGVSSALTLFDTLDTLVAVSHTYGPPARGRLAAELEPYRKSFANLAGGYLKLIQNDSSRLESWQAMRRYTGADVIKLLKAYAGLR